MLTGKVLIRDVTTGQYKKTRTVSWTPMEWDDGFLRPDGYFAVYMPEHPASTASGWVRRHHAVYWLLTGEAVPRGMDLHHKDGIKLHDDFTNLELMDHARHAQISNEAKSVAAAVERVCVWCKCTFYLPKNRMRSGPTRGTYCSQECYYAAGGRWARRMVRNA